MRYDVERLQREISMPSLIRYICDSSEIHKTGTTMFCKCVSGLHQESQYNHNAVYEKKTHCYTCGVNYDAFEYVRKYYEMEGRSLSFSEVCEKVAESLGDVENYVLRGEIKKEERVIPKDILFTLRLSPKAEEYLKTLTEDERKRFLRERSREMEKYYGKLGEKYPKVRDDLDRMRIAVRQIFEGNR